MRPVEARSCTSARDRQVGPACRGDGAVNCQGSASERRVIILDRGGAKAARTLLQYHG